MFAKVTWMVQYQQMDFVGLKRINTAVSFTHAKDTKLKLQGSLWTYDLNCYTNSYKSKQINCILLY